MNKINICRFSKYWFNFTPYDYQKEFLESCLTHKRISARWCRQSGKSTNVSIYTNFKMLTHPGVSIIITAPAHRQSKELYMKIRDLALNNKHISNIIKKCTETELILENNSRTLSLPVGPEGGSIKGFTADIAVIEEAQGVKDSIVNSVIVPMLASKKDEGQIIKIGTPLTKNHFYDSCFNDNAYKSFHVDWRRCVAEGQYSQEFVDEQRKNLTDVEFTTEYEAQFLDEAIMFFPAKLIDTCMDTYSLIQLL